MKIEDETYSTDGPSPLRLTLIKEVYEDEEKLNAIEQWIRNDDDSFIKELLGESSGSPSPSNDPTQCQAPLPPTERPKTTTLTPEQVKNLRELFGSLHDKYQHYGGVTNDSYLEKFNEILEE